MIKAITCLMLFMLFSHMSYAQEQINYDESNVPDYTLPALFETADGQQADTRDRWESQRRPEIIRLFEEHVYGQVPRHFTSVNFELVNENREALEGSAHLKEVDISVIRNGNSVTIRLNLFIPNSVNGPAPVFLLINNRGPETMDPTRKIQRDFWPVEEIIPRGYAAGVFDIDDVSVDDADSFHNGILELLYPEQLKQPDGMRSLSAWAWGAMRIMDYFEHDREIDEGRAAVVGHSRGGKAALWTGAQDTRWSITISNESGCGGAALSRRRYGETVQRINNAFPHWFTPNFEQYNDNESALPVDQHMLIASIAPRPVYVASAKEDRWADPRGEYLSLKHGSEVYEKVYLLPVNLSETMPEVNEPVTQSYAGYHIRNGKHNLTLYDWQRFMDFADHHLAKDKW